MNCPKCGRESGLTIEQARNRGADTGIRKDSPVANLPHFRDGLVVRWRKCEGEGPSKQKGCGHRWCTVEATVESLKKNLDKQAIDARNEAETNAEETIRTLRARVGELEQVRARADKGRELVHEAHGDLGAMLTQVKRVESDLLRYKERVEELERQRDDDLRREGELRMELAAANRRAGDAESEALKAMERTAAPAVDATHVSLELIPGGIPVRLGVEELTRITQEAAERGKAAIRAEIAAARDILTGLIETSTAA